ncbi:hypothetical protein TSUD_193060 [Trifolium subterraneum]|uniref:Valyl-tRNA synthetase tRNA-binding arm domain-containing protein n=1 Tax=Trifolium subterraneum TaxID=3900 RepID=A0A2Z6PMA4_TRISU|nr:hypothetical protein TSUD_193060 [Trifolium subterraneum]
MKIPDPFLLQRFYQGKNHYLFSLLRTLHTPKNSHSSSMGSSDIKKDQAPPAPEDPEKKKKKEEKAREKQLKLEKFLQKQAQVDPEVEKIIRSHQLEITTLANLSSLTVITEPEIEDIPSGYADTLVNESLSVYLELQGINSEEAKLGKMKKIDELKKLIDKLEKNMNAPGYEKSPQQVQSKDMEKLKSQKEHLRLLLEETAALSL